jgi:Domain of unknown function (DUF4267)
VSLMAFQVVERERQRVAPTARPLADAEPVARIAHSLRRGAATHAPDPRRRPWEETPSVPPWRDPATWPALVLACVFVALGGLLVAAPRWGGAVYGLPAPEGETAAWPAIVGIRDLVFGLYLLALAVTASRRALAVVLGVTVLIPVGDVLLLLVVRGGDVPPGSLLLHLASAGVLAAAAALTAQSRSGP